MLNWTLGFLVCGFKPFFRPGFRISNSMRFGVFPVTVRKICSSTTSIACTSSLILLAVFRFDRNLLRFCGFLVFFVWFCGFLYAPLPPPCWWTILDLSLASFVRPSAAFVFTAVIHFLEIENGTLPRSGYVYRNFSSTKRKTVIGCILVRVPLIQFKCIPTNPTGIQIPQLLPVTDITARDCCMSKK